MPPVPAAPLVRREIWSLERTSTWDPHTLAFAKAIREMKTRPFPANQSSYRYQAAMHGTDNINDLGPNGVWNGCQHASWFFLPWHRMYILWFERIVRKIVLAQGGPADWALPYWNWQTNRALPPAFRERNLPASAGGGANPLFISNRVAVNNGTAMLPAVVDSTQANGSTQYAGSQARAFGFAGGVINNPSHFGAGLTGLLESQPHNNVHRTIGSFMATAASPLDPIFWLHHGQIDRLWGKWLRLAGGRANPTDSRWLTQKFTFYDADLKKVTQTPADVVSTVVLGYRYDDDPPPSAVPLAAFAPRHAAAARKATEELTPVSDEPEELGVSGPVELGTGATSTPIELVQQPDNNLELLAAPNTAPSSVALLVEGITFDDPAAAPIYEVYLNIPDVGDGGHHDSRYFVGFLEFFGADHDHGGHEGHGAGMKRAFDITTLVHQLQQEGEWDPARVEVTFVPAHLFEDAKTGRPLPPEPMEHDPGVHVGAVRILTE